MLTSINSPVSFLYRWPAVVLLPCALAVLSYALWINTWPAWSQAVRVAGTAVALLVMAMFAHTPAGGLPRALGSASSQALPHHWSAWVWLLMWGAAWAAAWLVLPAPAWLRVGGAASFLALAYLGGCGAAQPRQRVVVALVLAPAVVGAGLVALMAQVSPYAVERLMADLTGPLLPQGRHAQHVRIAEHVQHLSAFGASNSAWPMRLDGTTGIELLQLAQHTGVVAAWAIASVLVLGLAWLAWRFHHAAKVVGEHDRRWARLGLVLVLVQVCAAVCAIGWSMGWLRQRFSGALPLLNADPAWWLVLLVTLGIAYRVVPGTLNHAPSWRWRMQAGLAFVVAAMAGTFVIGVATDHLAKSALYGALQLRSGAPSANRADIVDRHGEVLATTVQRHDVWVYPARFHGPSLANPRPALGTSEISPRPDRERYELLRAALAPWPLVRDVALQRLARTKPGSDTPAILAWAVDDIVARALRATALEGIEIKPRLARHYPLGAPFAHVVGFGFRDPSMKGLEGLELAAERQLREEGAVALATTLDARVQQTIHSALARVVAASPQGVGPDTPAITGAAVVALHVPSGQIRALVGAPFFDPNDVSTYREPYRPEVFRNRAVHDFATAGGLLAPALAAQVIESGRATPDTRFADLRQADSRVRPSPVSGRDRTVIEAAVSGAPDVAVHLAALIPARERESMLHTLGFSRQWGLSGVPGTLAPLPELESDEPVQAERGIEPAAFATTMPLNLMQVMRAFEPFASGGVLRQWKLAQGVQGCLVCGDRQVLSTATASALHLALVDSAQRTAARLAIPWPPGSAAAGGTFGSHSTGSPQALMVGMTPGARPQWLVGVMLQVDDAAAQGARASSKRNQAVADALAARATRLLATVLEELPGDR